MPIITTAQNVARQPAAWPSAVPNGTPSTLARVNPVNISAIACALFAGGATLAATTAPSPKNAPWENAVTIRAPREKSITWRDCAEAVAENKDPDEQQQCQTAFEARGGDRENRRTECHAQRVAGNEQARLRDRHGKIMGNVRQ